MYNPQTIYTEIALNAITEYLKNGNILQSGDFPELEQKASCFVTLKSGNGKLRGCIGTLSPVHEDLQQEIIRNAIAAATRDSRFEELTLYELDEIILSVEVLYPPEKIESIDKLDVKKYGLIISDGNFRRGVLLPNIEGVETVEYQISIVKRKAGIFDESNEGYEFSRFKAEKYY